MNDLPRVFVNPINKEFDNFQKECNSNKMIKKIDNRNLSMKIKDIFDSRSYIYRRKVLITTKDGIVEKTIVGKTNNALLTFNGEKIKINDIYNVEIL